MVPHQEKGTNMSKTASIGLLPSSTLFSRLMASIDRAVTEGELEVGAEDGY